MKRRVLTLCLVLALLTAAFAPALATSTDLGAPETETPTAKPTEVASEVPTQEPTEAPATEVPVTEAPATEVPATEKPTDAPTAEPAYESAADWDRSVSAAVLNGEWAHDILAVAATQVGYTAQANYVRYAAWYGKDASSEWSAMFAAFVVKYAGIAHDDLPYTADAASFKAAMDYMGAYSTEHQPQAGDLVFFTYDGATAQHMAIVSAVNGSSIETIEGDVSGQVARTTYAISDGIILGYADVALLEARSKVENVMPEDAPAIPAEGMTAYLCASDVNMRAAATTDSDKVGRIKKYGTELLVTSAEKNEQGEVWYVVTYGDVTGYVRADFVTLTQPTVTQAPTAEPTVEPTEEPAEEPTAEPTVEVTEAPATEPTAEPAEEPTAEPTVIPAEDIPAEDIPATATDAEEPAEEQVQPEATATAEPEASTGMTIIAQPESNWQPGDEGTSLSFIVENAVSYLWQQGSMNRDGSMSWNDILNSNTSTLSFYTDESTLPYAYRSIATDADGATVTSEATYVTELAKIVGGIKWLYEYKPSWEMIERALRAGSLDKIVLEGDYFIDVRTGKSVAYVDPKTNYVIDLNTQLIIAQLTSDNEIVPYNAQ